ncbi:Zinc finger C2H2 [Penicillium paradoxum]|uniref:Zinc finger C2H2 n=1 Tax=Penicillium paradoxum TaxID=176176 RepID=UPI0025470B31|nr:Zinc finger C2H2 [Penicillium paradoxum]KAJ5780215.1 Zinc finger C2H2 [Penicillium paradoxum]
MSYLEQEGDDGWNGADPSFSYLINEWSPPHDVFPYETVESPSVSLTPNPVVPTTPGTSYAMTDDQYDNGPSIDEEPAVDTPGLDIQDAASDITSAIMSPEQEYAPVTGRGILRKPTSYGKAPMIAKSRHGSPLKCQWKHCEYTGGFSQMAALLRHIKTKHISPGLFECHEGECRKSFNRKDNLVAHIRSIHRTNI